VPSPFAPNTLIYTLTVPNSVNSITIEATATDSKRHSVTGTGAKFISVGENPFTITVTAEDNSTTKEYLLIVTRQVAGSNNANLSNLSVSGHTISPAFGVNVISYTLTVPNSVSSITIGATKADNNASVTGAGAKDITVGSNLFDIVVTAEDGTTKTYTITLTRSEAGGATPATYTVTFNSQGGSNVSPQEVSDGSTLTPPSEPTRAGYVFGGWYYEASCSNEWYFDGDVVTGNITLYAKWTTGTAIETVNTDKLQIYPNPTNGIVHISNADGAEIKVYNLKGELLQTTRESRVNLSGYSNGIYLLQIGDETWKVVKQ
jgi:uncharacterized repeat protein (TIGR02543 family)